MDINYLCILQIHLIITNRHRLAGILAITLHLYDTIILFKKIEVEGAESSGNESQTDCPKFGQTANRSRESVRRLSVNKKELGQAKPASVAGKRKSGGDRHGSCLAERFFLFYTYYDFGNAIEGLSHHIVIFAKAKTNVSTLAAKEDIRPHYDTLSSQSLAKLSGSNSLRHQLARHRQPQEHPAIRHACVVPTCLLELSDRELSSVAIDLPNLLQETATVIKSRCKSKLGRRIYAFSQNSLLIQHSLYPLGMTDTSTGSPLRRLEHLGRSEYLTEDSITDLRDLVDTRALMTLVTQLSVSTITDDMEVVLLCEGCQSLEIGEIALHARGVLNVTYNHNVRPKSFSELFFQPIKETMVFVALNEHWFATCFENGGIMPAVKRLGHYHYVLFAVSLRCSLKKVVEDIKRSLAGSVRQRYFRFRIDLHTEEIGVQTRNRLSGFYVPPTITVTVRDIYFPLIALPGQSWWERVFWTA